MKVYTIGFTKKSAEEFFNTLKSNDIKLVLDIRLNNKSQLAGFAKGRDLEYFLGLLDIGYIHEERFAPSDELLKGYKKGEITWNEYIEEYSRLLSVREVDNVLKSEYKDKLDGACLLCSEHIPDKCHRRLLAEFIRDRFSGVEIIHL